MKPTGAGGTVKKSDLKELVEAAKEAWDAESDPDSSTDSDDLKDID